MGPKPDKARPQQSKVAIVSGGGGANSIGRAICLRLAQEGARVAVLDINTTGAAKVVEEIVTSGGEALSVTCDITDLDQCRAAAKRVAEHWTGRIEILVNNAAFTGDFGERRSFD